MTKDAPITISPAVVTRRDYCVEISNEDMLAISRAENISKSPHLHYHHQLLTRLQGDGTAADADIKGVDSVEYDPMFGAAIFYRVNAEDDAPELHAEIAEIIRETIEDSRRIAAVQMRKEAHQNLLRARSSCSSWNKKHRIGTPVKVYVKGLDETFRSHTISKASVVNGEAVVSLPDTVGYPLRQLSTFL